MKKSYLSLQNFLIVIVGAIFIISGLIVLNSGAYKAVTQRSVEVGVVSLSPKGEAGGFAIPASCPSFEHSPGECSPDLTVTQIIPSDFTPSVGQTVTVIGDIKNIGGTTAPASTARWCKTDNLTACYNGTAGSLGTPSVFALTPNQTFTTPTISYTIEAGFNELALCADAVGNAVSESNESATSNCLSWPYSATPIIRFVLNSVFSSVVINAGDPVTIEWGASTEATSCSGLNFSTGGAVSGSTTVSPSSDTTYTILCTYASGTFQSSAFVDVINSTINLSANPTQVRSGNQSTIVWSATNVDSCTTTGPGGFSKNTISGSAPSGPLTQQSVFIFTCQNAGGTLSRTATVFIIPSFEEF